MISNHPDHADVAAHFGVEFAAPAGDTRVADRAGERDARRCSREHDIDFVVLARYMQILSPFFLDAYPLRIINIHHGFLPAFAGARPYHQAGERGVKLIGATSHYATEMLDDGPIIEQDTIRVTHRDTVADLIRKGRDIETGSARPSGRRPRRGPRHRPRPPHRRLLSRAFLLRSDRSEHVELRGPPGREDGGDDAGERAITTTTTSRGTGTTNPSKPWSARACTMAQPKNSPMTRPSAVPSRAMITDSHRTVDRSWRRVMPTARNSPSSRVRSKIDRASVLAMPMRAMTTARRAGRRSGQDWLIWLGLRRLELGVFCTSALGSALGLDDRAGLRRHARRCLHEDWVSSWS